MNGQKKKEHICGKRKIAPRLGLNSWRISLSRDSLELQAMCYQGPHNSMTIHSSQVGWLPSVTRAPTPYNNPSDSDPHGLRPASMWHRPSRSMIDLDTDQMRGIPFEPFVLNDMVMVTRPTLRRPPRGPQASTRPASAMMSSRTLSPSHVLCVVSKNTPASPSRITGLGTTSQVTTVDMAEEIWETHFAMPPYASRDR